CVSVAASACSSPSVLLVCFFFFSSRRRHTRCYRDWSSDVCSSDLRSSAAAGREAVRRASAPSTSVESASGGRGTAPAPPRPRREIGRASCRERVVISEVGGSIYNKIGEMCSYWRLGETTRLG